MSMFLAFSRASNCAFVYGQLCLSSIIYRWNPPGMGPPTHVIRDADVLAWSRYQVIGNNNTDSIIPKCGVILCNVDIILLQINTVPERLGVAIHLVSLTLTATLQIGSPGLYKKGRVPKIVSGSPPPNTYFSSIPAKFFHAPGILTKIWTTGSRSPTCLHGPRTVMVICALAWIICTPSRCAYHYITGQSTERERPSI